MHRGGRRRGRLRGRRDHGHVHGELRGQGARETLQRVRRRGVDGDADRLERGGDVGAQRVGDSRTIDRRRIEGALAQDARPQESGEALQPPRRRGQRSDRAVVVVAQQGLQRPPRFLRRDGEAGDGQDGTVLDAYSDVGAQGRSDEAVNSSAVVFCVAIAGSKSSTVCGEESGESGERGTAKAAAKGMARGTTVAAQAVSTDGDGGSDGGGKGGGKGGEGDGGWGEGCGGKGDGDDGGGEYVYGG